MRAVIALLVLAFLVILVWVAVANWQESVKVSVGFEKEREVSLMVVIFASTGAGILFTGILAVLEGLALRVENLHLRRRLRRLEEEITELRTLALQGQASLDRESGPSAVPDPT